MSLTLDSFVWESHIDTAANFLRFPWVGNTYQGRYPLGWVVSVFNYACFFQLLQFLFNNLLSNVEGYTSVLLNNWSDSFIHMDVE